METVLTSLVPTCVTVILDFLEMELTVQVCHSTSTHYVTDIGDNSHIIIQILMNVLREQISVILMLIVLTLLVVITAPV